mmetsp:Transcript_6282/g.11168  ORF Transcript_6282/g.11168 Transcript_6282/m.11168 type:complete len:211 (+) Transcript_6282:62-694(+)
MQLFASIDSFPSSSLFILPGINLDGDGGDATSAHVTEVAAARAARSSSGPESCVRALWRACSPSSLSVSTSLSFAFLISLVLSFVDALLLFEEDAVLFFGPVGSDTSFASVLAAGDVAGEDTCGSSMRTIHRSSPCGKNPSIMSSGEPPLLRNISVTIFRHVYWTIPSFWRDDTRADPKARQSIPSNRPRMASSNEVRLGTTPETEVGLL